MNFVIAAGYWFAFGLWAVHRWLKRTPGTDLAFVWLAFCGPVLAMFVWAMTRRESKE